MSLAIEITRALPLFPSGTFLQWDLIGATESGTYTFDVYRGASENGAWEPIVTGAADLWSYVDRLPTSTVPNEVQPDQLRLVTHVMYRVDVTPPSGPAGRVSVVSPVEPRLQGRQKLIKRKILRDTALGLRKLNGVEVAVLKRKHFGVRCNKCFDKYTKEMMRGNCSTCYGTGYLKGYYDPIITLARPGHAPVHTQLTPQGETDAVHIRMVLLDAPRVQKGDVLISLQDNRRFLVELVDPVALKTVLVYQTLTVSELARNSIEYRVKVDPTRIPALF